MAIGVLSAFGFGYVFSRLLPGPQKDLQGLTVHTTQIV
jgi:hypothetical protein